MRTLPFQPTGVVVGASTSSVGAAGTSSGGGASHVAEAQLDGTLPQHPLAVRVASGTIATSPSVAQGQLDGTLPQDPLLAVRVVGASGGSASEER